MTIIIPDGFAQVTINYDSTSFISGRAATVYGAEIGENSLVATADNVIEAFEENLLPLLSEFVTVSSVRVITETEAVEQTAGLIGGTDQPPAEPSIALLTRKLTLRRGRRAQGRMFWPGMAYEATFNRQGVMNEDSYLAYQGAMTGFYTDLTTDMAILQNTEGETPPISPPPNVIGLLVDRRAATQRRRMR